MKPTAERRDAGFERLVERELARGTSPSGHACPQVELLAAWFDRSLPPSSDGEGTEASTIEVHLASCTRCQAVVAGLARAEPETLYVHPTPLPAARAWMWHLRWAAPLGAAACVALLVAAQWRQVPSSPALPPAAGPHVPVLMSEPLSGPLAAPSSAPAEALAVPSGPTEGKQKAGGPGATPPSPAPMVLAQQKALADPSPSFVGRHTTYAAPAPAASVLAADGRSGWKYLRPGAIARTLDGGASWTEHALPGSMRLTLLSAASSQVCWGAGPGGALVQTRDGVSWHAVNSPVQTDLVGLVALSAVSAKVRTTDGFTYETRDGGTTWQTTNTSKDDRR